MLQKNRVEASRKSLQMATLQLHLSPHFIFNALSSVQWKLQDDQVRQAQLLFQPAIENAIWHGFSRPIQNPKIHLVIRELPTQPGWIQASILDNGIGLNSDSNPQQVHHKSVGMNVTQERLTILHPQASVEVMQAATPWSTE